MKKRVILENKTKITHYAIENYYFESGCFLLLLLDKIWHAYSFGKN